MTTAVKSKTVAEIVEESHLAGMNAANAATPKKYNVVNENNEIIDTLDDGLCGFAWITIRPARGSLVAYLKAEGIGDKGWSGGWTIWVNKFGQSYDRKYAYAKAFANTLCQYGIDAQAGARLD